MARKTVRKPRAQAKRDNTTLLIVGAIGAVVVVLIAIWFWSTPNTSGVSAAGKVWGKADAPVTLEIFSDFQ